MKLNNIRLESIRDSISVKLTSSIEVTPLQVPHRDEFTETVGFQVQTKSKGLLFIPDIDKWEKWSTDIKVMVENNDYALLDATFFGADELPGRDMSEIPHPFVVESLKLFDPLKISHKSKVHFIQFNHSNPLLIPNSPARDMVTAEYNLAEEGLIFLL